SLTLVIATNQDPASSNSLQIVQTKLNIGSYGNGPVRVCVGTILDQSAATFCIAWADPDNQLNVQVWQTDADLNPTLVAHIAQTPLPATANLDITLGDFDQD